AVADFKDFTNEVNENNNTYIHSVTIEEGILPDLIFSKFSLSDYDLYGGDKFTFDTQVKNQGTDTSNAWKVQFYLSSEQIADHEIKDIDPVFTTPVYEKFLSPDQTIGYSYEMQVLKSIMPGK